MISSEREACFVWILALAIYLPAIWWGLPYATHALGTHSWEIDAVTGMQTLAELHNLFIEPKPDWYLAYPTFHYLLVGAAYAPYLAFLFLTGQFSQPTPEYPFGFADPVTAIRNLTLIARAITVLMASGIVVSAYLTSKTTWDRRTARITALAVALPTTMVFYARTGNLEIPVLFWISLSVLMIARSVKMGFTVSRAVGLGVFAALAVATKDAAYAPLTVGLIFLIVTHVRAGMRDKKGTLPWKAPAALILTGGIIFSFASGLLISPYRFFEHLHFVRNFDKTFYLVIHLDNLHPKTIQGYWALTLEFAFDLFTAIGPVLLIAGSIGLIVACRESVLARLLTLMFFAQLLLVVFPVRHMQYRYIMVPAFIMAFFVARGFAEGLQNRRKWVVNCTIIAMIVGFGWVTLRAVDLTYQMIFDARYSASVWIKENVGNDKIGFFTVQNILPHLDKGTKAVQLIEDPAPVARLQNEKIPYVLVQADWSSEIGSDRSLFFPDDVYRQLTDGSLGYQELAVFRTEPLFRGFFLDLPQVTPGYIVNTPIKVFGVKKHEDSDRD